jgi:hemoglobin/transferrin/lactoferrin receptor protein
MDVIKDKGKKMMFRRSKVMLLGMTMLATGFLPAPGWTSDDPGSAGDDTVVMEEMVVTARGVPTLLSETPGGVGVVDAEEIFREQPVSVTDVLERIPGVNKSSDSPWGSEVNIRGLGRGRVVFLIDGVRVNTATDISAQFGLIDPNDIERVEVLKGPVSALYGSGSIGGVVNIITRKGQFTDEPSWSGTLAGTFNSNPEGFKGYAGLSSNTPDYWVSASGSFRDLDSYKDGSGDTIHNSQFEDFGGTFKLARKWNELHQTSFQYQHFEGREIGIPGTGNASLPLVADVTYPETYRRMASLVHTFVPGNPVWNESTLNLYFQEIDRNVRIDQLPQSMGIAGIFPSANHKTWGLRWFNALDAGDHALSAGVDVWQWDIESLRQRHFTNGNLAIDQPVADASQLSAGLFAEDSWVLGRTLTLNIGGRVDLIRADSDEIHTWITPPNPAAPNPLQRQKESFDDTSWSGHLGLTWAFVENWSMTLIGASSYRAPDLLERFKYINLGSYEVFGTPDLDPERSRFLEYGLHYNRPGVTASLNAYVNLLTDLIVEKTVSPGRHEMQNVDEAEIYGAEAAVEWRFLPRWAAYGNLAYTHGKNKTENTDLESIPPFSGLAGVRYLPDLGLNGNVEVQWADRQSRVAPGENETPGWATLNARAGYRFQWAGIFQELSLSADNLLDKAYRNHLATGRKPAELNSPGLNLAVTWKMEF